MSTETLARPTTTSETIYFNEDKIRRDLLIRRVGKLGLLLNPIFSYAFLWAPILILVIFSFNDSRTVATWRGFTFKWYENIFTGVLGQGALFSTQQMLEALQNSLVIGVAATLIATVIGTMVAISMVRSNFPGKRILDGVLFLPVVIPEITQGISLLIFFSVIFNTLQGMIGYRPSLGYGSIIIGHVVFNISYVTIVVRARLVDMNPRLEEAARDLGANEWQTFWRVTFPLLFPAILSGALLAFTLSLDDYIVTYFTAAPGTTTLPIFVFGLIRFSITPEINAISTLILIASIVLIALSVALQGRDALRR